MAGYDLDLFVLIVPIFSLIAEIQQCDFSSCKANPKLEKLHEMILKAYSGDDMEDCRGIVFVKTPELARAIVSWMKETPGLRELKPIQFLEQDRAFTGGKHLISLLFHCFHVLKV